MLTLEYSFWENFLGSRLAGPREEILSGPAEFKCGSGLLLKICFRSGCNYARDASLVPHLIFDFMRQGVNHPEAFSWMAGSDPRQSGW